jgi:hypothetical protein
MLGFHQEWWVFIKRVDPLHVGRKYRTATAKMRKALAARDLHCLWPGCDRPPVWTEKHHIDPWVGGGKTEVERMCLLCKKHHPKVTAGWRLERGPGGEVIAHPPPPREPVYGTAVYEPPPGRGP